MHPEIETFLDDAFGSIEPTSPAIGRVVVEPDYEISPTSADAAGLASELLECLREQAPAGLGLTSQEGVKVPIPGRYGLLTKYLRSITLHSDKLDGAWVEVAPPGNWI